MMAEIVYDPERGYVNPPRPMAGEAIAPAPEYGDEFHLLRCRHCRHEWIGRTEETCPRCVSALEASSTEVPSRNGHRDHHLQNGEGDLGAVLDDVVAYLDRFMAMSAHQLVAVSLWVAHTYAAEALDVVAYLFVTSAEKRCGKTLLLDLLEHLCLRGRPTANISPAALYRMVEEVRPTLLFDEVDNIFTPRRGGLDPAKSDLVGLINAGFRRGRVTYRMGGANMRTLEQFDPFGPKALAGIGGCLPDTVDDRCIPIKLTRKHRGEAKERYRLRLHEPEVIALGRRVEAAVSVVLDDIRDSWPELPAELSDRAQDIWEPLLALADRAGGDWPARARAAAINLHAARSDSDDSVGVQLLADLRDLFAAEEADRLASAVIIDKLNALEERPWGGWHRGDGFKVRDLAKMLRAFEVSSRKLRIGNTTPRGYLVDDLADAFERYTTPLASCSGTGATSGTGLARGVPDVPLVPERVANTADGGPISEEIF
jgi:hypothetical protein